MKRKLIIVTIQSEDESHLHLNAKSFGDFLAKEVRSAGGQCIANWNGSALTLTIQGADPATINGWVSPFADAARQHGHRLKIHQLEKEMPAGFALPVLTSGPGIPRREKLTKRLFFGLPTGAFLVSNLYPGGRSAFAEKLGAPATRSPAWKRVVGVGADQRLCQVLWTQEEFIKAAYPRSGLAS